MSLTAIPARKPTRRNRGRSVNAPEQFVGIDIGVDEVRIAALSTDPQTSELRWASADQFALPIDEAIANSPAIVDSIAEALATRLPRILEGIPLRAQIAVPPTWVHFQHTSPTELAGVVAQSEGMFRASVFQCGMHYRTWPCNSEGSRLMIAATASTASQRLVETIAETGYEIGGVIPGAIAINHIAEPLTGIPQFHSTLWMEPSGCVAAIYGRSGDGRIDRQLLNCRSLRPYQSDSSSDEPLKALSRGLGKALPSLTAIHSWLRSVAIELRATAKFCGRDFDWREESGLPILIAGSFAEIPGIDQALASLMGVPVATWAYDSDHRPTGVECFPGHSNVTSTMDGRGTDVRYAAALSMAHTLAEKHGVALP